MIEGKNPWKKNEDHKFVSLCLTRSGFFFSSLLVMAVSYPAFLFNEWVGLGFFSSLYTLVAYFRMRDWSDQRAGMTAILLFPIMLAVGLGLYQGKIWLFLIIHALLTFKRGYTKANTLSFLQNELKERWQIFALKRKIKTKKRGDLIQKLQSELRESYDSDKVKVCLYK
jgi:hypothetical protein